MGLLRMIIAASAMLLLQNSTGALAQSREQQTIDEIVRKAEAGENENGFCSRVGWPRGDNWEGFAAFLKSASVGTWKVNTFANGNCELDRVTRVHQEGGARCVTYSIWVCQKDNTCGTNNVVDCLDRNEKLTRRQN
jgi:hypothetical protein